MMVAMKQLIVAVISLWLGFSRVVTSLTGEE